MENYDRIPEDDYKKLLFQARGQVGAILNVFKCYGMNVHVEQAIVECMLVTENFGMSVRGKNKPLHILAELKRKDTD